MTEHDPFDRLFEGVDGPIPPNPLFAARLRRQLVAGVAGAPNPAPGPVISALPAAPRPLRRHRWLDLAAAAVLLIGIISGLASLAPTGPATPRAIEAPDTSQPPVMSSGSAAQDGQIPGTIPEPGDAFNLLWEDDAVPDDVRYTSGGLIFGDSLFQMDGDGTTYELRARSLQTGEELWRAELSIDLSYAVTSRGVVMSRSEYGSQAFSVALLDRHTGAPIWQTDAIYEPSTNPLGTALVVNDTIFFVDRAMTMVALDLASGTERWRYDAAQGRSTAEMLGECTAASATCGRQAFRSSGFAIGRDALYLFAPVPDEVVALAITDGARAWVVDASERTGLKAPDVSLMATSQGLVVGASAPSSTVSVGTSQYLSLWSSDDGAEQWMQPIWTGYAVSMGSTLLISKVETSEMDDAVCCTLITIATATGETLGTTRLGDFRLAGYYPESDSVATFRLITQGGLEPSRIETWFILQFSTGPVELTQPIPDCATLTPSRDGRYLVCQRASGATAVYEPASVSATPAAVASPPPDVALQTRVAELEATIAALEPGQTATSFDQIDQGSAEVTITIDAQGLLEDDPAAEAAAIAAIREALAPYRDCRVGIALTFGWDPNVGTGSAISSEVNDLLREAEPELFADAVTENFANIGPQGRADLTLYFFRGCQVLDDEPGPTPSATEHELAAQDGQRVGVFPPADAGYELLWEDEPSDKVFQSGGPARLWGDVLYQTVSEGSGTELKARDILSGDVLWQMPVAGSFAIAVTAGGVVAGLPVEDDEIGRPEAFTLALLDRQSGAVIWQTERQYRHSGELGLNVVDEQTVMFVDDSLAIVAIDLADGSERWRYDATRGRTEAEMLGECTPLSQTCGDRPFQLTHLALWDDTLYVYLPTPAEVIALSAGDGSLRWVASVPERTGQQSSDVRLLATEWGVVVTATDARTTEVLAASFSVELWAERDGAELWVRAGEGGVMARANSSLFLVSESDWSATASACCTLRELDIATGAIVSERPTDDALPLLYFPASDVLLLYRPPGQSGIIRDLLADDSAPVAPLPIPECSDGLLPSADGRHLLCLRPDTTLAVYAVKEGEATPTP